MSSSSPKSTNLITNIHYEIDGNPLAFGGLSWNLGVYLGLIGLTFLEYGAVRKVNSNHLLLKNLLIFSTSFAVWWLVGYAFALGQNDNNFIGADRFGGQDWLVDIRGLPPSYFGLIGVFVQFIINGTLAEKTQYIAYVVNSFWIMIVFWPIVVAWIWTDGGWLQNQLDSPVQDYGFTITVYVFAGTWALIGGGLTGRRLGRFSRIQELPRFSNENQAFYYIGALLTIIGVFTLNNDFQAGVKFEAFGGFGNSWVAGSASSIVSLKLLTLFNLDLQSHFTAVYQGFIAGMVLISSSANCQAWEAAFFGIAAGLIFSLGVKFLVWLKYDDPLNVVPTFLMPGLAGGVLPGFLDSRNGVFWAGFTGNLLAVQVVATVVVCAWACFWAIVVFGLLRVFGLLILSDDIQSIGLVGTELGQKGFELVNREKINEARY